MQVLKSVEYPATLTLPPEILSDELKSKYAARRTSTSGSSVCYQLQAVVLHHGKKATGGHYSAFTLEVQYQPKERGALRDVHIWRSVNDSKVNVVNEQQVLQAQDLAYILFYGRIHN